MIYRARTSRDADGSWIAAAVELPHCWSRAATREDALRRLRDEIRYRIELCPCSAVDEEFVQVEVVPQEAGTPAPSAGGTIAAPWRGVEADSSGGERRRGWRRWDD